MDVFTAVETAIYSRLSQNQNIVNLIGTNPNNPITQYQIYNGQAPIKAPYPLIVFNLAAGDNQNDTHATAFHLIYRFTSWCYDKSQARLLSGYIRDSLDKQQIQVGDKLMYQIVERQLFSNLANVEGNQVHGYGSTYEFLVQ